MARLPVPPAPASPAGGRLPEWVRPDGARGCQVAVAAVPGAARSEIIGVHDGCLRVRLAAPPVDGKANDELVRFIAQALGLPRREVSLERGPASRRKSVRVALDAGSVARRLAPPHRDEGD